MVFIFIYFIFFCVFIFFSISFTAPAHCLQYITGAVGRFQSFNYGNIKSIEENTYFLNMNYAICIRKEASMCGATFTADSDFNVSVYNSTLNCSNDYLSFGTSRKCGRIRKEELNSVRLGKKHI